MVKSGSWLSYCVSLYLWSLLSREPGTYSLVVRYIGYRILWFYCCICHIYMWLGDSSNGYTQVLGEWRHYTWWFKVGSGRCGVGIWFVCTWSLEPQCSFSMVSVSLCGLPMRQRFACPSLPFLHVRWLSLYVTMWFWRQGRDLGDSACDLASRHCGVFA